MDKLSYSARRAEQPTCAFSVEIGKFVCSISFPCEKRKYQVMNMVYQGILQFYCGNRIKN